MTSYACMDCEKIQAVAAATHNLAHPLWPLVSQNIPPIEYNQFKSFGPAHEPFYPVFWNLKGRASVGGAAPVKK